MATPRREVIHRPVPAGRTLPPFRRTAWLLRGALALLAHGAGLRAQLAVASPDATVPLAASEPPVALDKMVVTPSRYGIAQERLARNVTLTSEELATLPQIGEDLYRTISRLPGLGSNEISAKFLVRGAPNRQVLARLDGVDLIEPFHLKDYDGALSIVDLDTIDSVDLVTGGFTAEYGDRLAGVFTMETLPAPPSDYRTMLGISVTNLRAMSQGTFAGGDGDWLFTARRGYIDLALKLGGSESKDSPTYYDLSAKVQYRLSPHQTLSLHALYAADTFAKSDESDKPDFKSSYDSAYLWARWQGDFGERLSGEGVLSFSQLNWHREGVGFFDQIHPFSLRDDRRLTDVGLRSDWTLNLTPRALVRSGFEVKSGEARYDYDMSRTQWSLVNGDLLTITRVLDYHLRPDGYYEAAYVAPRFQPWTPLVIEPGLRFEHHTHTGDSLWSPRLNASLVFGRTTLRAAWGIYQQAQGLQELSVQDRETRFNPAERAEQRVLGVTRRLDSGIELRAEAYERLGSHLRPHWENRLDPIDLFPEAEYDRIRLAPTSSRARGIELMAASRANRRFGWSASYAYAINEELAGGQWIPGKWDQRHTFYADVTWAPTPVWQLSASWQIHSGWPYTDQNFFLQTLNNGAVITTWTYGPYGGLRAPTYHRLDFRATRAYRLRHGTLRAYVDIFNAYNQKNEVGFADHYAYISQGRLVVVKTRGTMLPLLPSFGLSWIF